MAPDFMENWEVIVSISKALLCKPQKIAQQIHD
jgi:hypothetical protein